MFFVPSLELIRNGEPKIRKFKRDILGRTRRVHAYVTIGSNCNSSCGFCRNKNFSDKIMEHDHSQLCNTLEKYLPYIHSIVFGGGEPLLYADKLYNIISNNDLIGYDTKSYIITNGSRKIFLNKLNDCRFCRQLSGIMLSRHHYDDSKNAEVFGNLNLLTESDIEYELCGALKNKMEFAITCSKGYIDSETKILEFIEWGKMLGINKFLFNNLQKAVTVTEYWDKHQIDSSIFNHCEDILLRQGYKSGIFVCYTAGYDIITYTKGDTRVGFKRYHNSRKETILKWIISKRHTYDLSIMPNGDIFSDWINQHKI